VAITQAICLYRKAHHIDGPLFIGMDTHALSEPAFANALEVLCANGVEVMIDRDRGYTPTPVISHAILTYNRSRKGGLADGIVITPSHNPLKTAASNYNPPNGGPADTPRHWTGSNAPRIRSPGGRSTRVTRIPYERACHAPSTHRHGLLWFLRGRSPKVVKHGGNPGARAGSEWIRSAAPACTTGDQSFERYGISANVVNDAVDPTFRFMTVDWDGKIPDGPVRPRMPWWPIVS